MTLVEATERLNRLKDKYPDAYVACLGVWREGKPAILVQDYEGCQLPHEERNVTYTTAYQFDCVYP